MGKGNGDNGPKPVSDAINETLATVGIILNGIGLVLCVINHIMYCSYRGWWALSVIGMGCAIAAIVMVKPECNLAIFICSLIAIILGIPCLWALAGLISFAILDYYSMADSTAWHCNLDNVNDGSVNVGARLKNYEITSG